MSQLPPFMQDEVRRAQAACDKYNADYEAYLRDALAKRGCADGRASKRFEQSLDILFGKKKIYFQEPLSYFFPELPQIQFYERAAPRRLLPIERAAGGRFVILNVDPGNYELVAVFTPESPLDARERETTTVAVTVGSTDIENLTVRTKRPARVSGFVVFDEGVPEKGPGNMEVMVRAEPAAAPGLLRVTPTARVRDDLSFELAGLHESGRLTVVGQPQDWVVKSVFYQGRDVANQPVSFETTTDPRAIEIHLTNRVAYVTGRAIAPDSRSLMVVLLPADRSQWTTSAGIAAQGGVRPDGTFTVGPVAAGEYLVLAATPQEFVEMRGDPGPALDRAAAGAMRLSLAENDRQKVTLYAK